MADRSQVRFETEELGVSVASFFVVDVRTHSGLRDIAKKPFHERHLTKSGFGKPKAAKLDNRCRVEGTGARRRLGRRQSRWHAIRRRLCCLRAPCPPAASRRP